MDPKIPNTKYRILYTFRNGQALLEIIVAVSIISFVSVSIALAITGSVRGVDMTMAKTTATFLSQEMTESVRAFTIEDWNNLDRLATSSANTYYATTSGGKWVHATGTETATFNGIQYIRRYWMDNVMRSTSTGNIVSSGGAWDPATKQITTRVTWIPQGIGAQEFSQVVYISRYTNNVFGQTDWSGGAIGDISITSETSTFATSSNVNFASNSGSIVIGEQ